MYRTKQVQKKYDRKKPAQTKCVFCELENKNIIEEQKHFYVIKNIFPYGYWDLKKVETHLMLIPKKHTDGFDPFTPDEDKEYIEVLKKYTEDGFDFFTRHTKSARKTQPHLHTHLIKTTGKIHKEMHFVQNPYDLKLKK